MKKRWIAMVLAGVLLLLSGCQTAQTTTTAAAGETSAAAQETTTSAAVQAPGLNPDEKTDPVTLTIYSEITNQQDPKKSKQENPPLWGEDEVSRAIMDMTGVKLLQLKDGSAVDLDVLLASNEWADLYAAQSIRANSPLEDASLCYSLDELAEQYCSTFWDETDPMEILNNTADDGHVYTLRSGYNNTAIYDDPSVPVYEPNAMGMNTQWLAKMGLNAPTSVEELDGLLYEIRDKAEDMGIGLNPMIMGDAITSPLAGWMGVMEDVYWDDESKTVRTPLRQNAWIEYLTLLNRWYRDGVLIFPQPEELRSYDAYDTEYDELAYFRRYGEMEGWLYGKSSISCFTSFTTERFEHVINLSKATEPNEKLHWQVIAEPLTYEGEVRRIAQDNGAWRSKQWGRYIHEGSGLFITKQCTNPERAILFYQFLKSEDGARLTHWGMEGVHYEKSEKGTPVYLEGYRTGDDFVEACFVTPEESYPRIRWAGICYWDFVPNSHVKSVYYADPNAFNDLWDVAQIRQQLNEAGLRYKQEAWENKNPVLQMAQPATGSDDYNRYEAIYHTWLVGVQQIVTDAVDTVDVQARWDALMTELVTMGLNDYEQAMTIRFADALNRYQQAGYYTEIQP